MARSGRVRRVTATPGTLGPPRRWELRDVRDPSAPTLRIERVVVAPSGVHVVTEAADTLDAPAEEAVDRSRAAADVVRSLLPARYRPRVRAVLTHRDVPDAPTRAGVLVTSPETFEHIVRYAPVVLSTSEMRQVHLRLASVLTPFPVPAPPARRTPWRRRLAVAGLAAASAATAVAVAVQETALQLPGW